MIIREARREDAAFLAEVVMEAIGRELSVELAGSPDRLPIVKELFAALGADPYSQYSYRNAFVAESDAGQRLGGIIAYDGARLHELRKSFVREANRLLGWNVTEKEEEEWGDEADKDEIYIDSLYVIPEARKQSIASSLLEAIQSRFKDFGKPLGLLVDPDNTNALATYRHWGFKEAGISNFFFTPMLHLQKI